MKILAIDDGIPPKTATATLTVIVQDINDNPPRFLKDYRPVLQEHLQPKKVVEISATDDDDRSKSNGSPFTFRMDTKADDVIRASFKVESDISKSPNDTTIHNLIDPLTNIGFFFPQRGQTEMVWPLYLRYEHLIENNKRNI